MASRKVLITFTFNRSGVQPPVFVAGSFSDPPWEPQEMVASKDQHGEFIFTKQIMVHEDSEIQYKFQHGSGDWWALDPNAETVTDEQGNMNSLLRCPIRNAAQEMTLIQNIHSAKLGDQILPDNLHTSDNNSITEASEPVFKAISTETSDANLSEDGVEKHGLRRLSSTPIEEVAMIAAEVADDAAKIDRDDSDELGNSGDLATPMFMPMFSHECFASSSDSQTACDEVTQPQQDSPDEFPEDGGDLDIDYDDPRLEHLPSDRNSIFAAMRRLSTSIEADPTVVEGISPPPVIAPTQLSGAGSPSKKRDSFITKELNPSTEQPTGIAASGTSLHSIAEGDEAFSADSARQSPEHFNAVSQYHGPAMKRHRSLESMEGNEDEGIAMSISPPKSTKKDTCVQTSNTKVHAVASNDEVTTGDKRSTVNNSSEGSSPSMSIEHNNRASLQKPANDGRPHSSSSIYSLRDASIEGNWLQAFLRSVFVDWIGGFFCWICGRGRSQVLSKASKTGSIIILGAGISLWALHHWRPSNVLPTLLGLHTTNSPTVQ
ncbi:hypothetical protein F5Y19DRAFT_491030 [Xylariaceae sp. FL1651]|nr:hypothetical protein F5Y19DRAFT_491030 [Xylariaceae sp. FL1651]